MFMEINSTTSPKPDLEHPEDGQYIWLPILVLIGVFVLAGLVYAMSRSRRLPSCVYCKRRNATRHGYGTVDGEDSDVSMAYGDEIGEQNSITSLLDSRLHIAEQQTNRRSSQIASNYVALDT